MANSNARFINTEMGVRASQACDRCRIKKTRCDGGNPCSKCASVGFLCTVSDKLARRSFPKGYTVNLENRIKELEKEIKLLKSQTSSNGVKSENPGVEPTPNPEIHKTKDAENGTAIGEPPAVIVKNQNHLIQINNPIDQIFNLDENGIIIGNDNLNFESQFNHLLINLKLPFLKITNSHNYLQDDPNTYLFHRSYKNYNNYHNKDLGVIYNPLTMKGLLRNSGPGSEELPTDVYDLFIKLVSNFKKLFSSKKELDHQIVQYFLNYNTFIPIFEYEVFMQGYDAFHTMYPFMFTYDDATINGFNLSSNDYQVVNEYLVLVIQIYAMILMNDPSLNLNLLLNHKSPNYTFRQGRMEKKNLVSSLYDFLPYLNVFHVSVNQLHTYLLFLYYSLITNNKEKSLVLSSLINAFIGILGVNLNCDNLFFSDLSLTLSQRRDRVKVFWSFKILLKCFNLKFGFKPTINTTVINPVTIDRYFKLTPEKLSLLVTPNTDGNIDSLFETLLAPSIEFLNLMNIVIPSSFSPNYYEYLKQDRHGGEAQNPAAAAKKGHTSHLDWILNDDDGDGNDGNLNYNYNQFLSIDKNLSNWRYALQDKKLNIQPLEKVIGLSMLSKFEDSSLYYRISFDGGNMYQNFGISQEGLHHYVNTGIPDVHSAIQLIKMQLHFHYLMIRSMNYLNFVIEHELASGYYLKIASISREVLAFFLIIFQHVGHSHTEVPDALESINEMKNVYDPFPSTFDIDEEGLIINDFSARRRRKDSGSKVRFPSKAIPSSPFNPILNGLSLTMINFKKIIVLQMLYLLICNLKIAKKGGSMSGDTLQILSDSISLFIKIFINYKPHPSNLLTINKKEEFLLFKRIINDELKDDILNDSNNDTDLEDEEANEIDWDDENMDEDLKYLKILKYIKYKTSSLTELTTSQGWKDNKELKPDILDSMVVVGVPGNNSLQQQRIPNSVSTLNSANPSAFLRFSPGTYTSDLNLAAIYPNFDSPGTVAKLGSILEKGDEKNKQERELANDLMSMRNGVLRQN
ncbi:hypothetical protein METBIDRAFT_33018 [Metschnikowia bicuspidata var. bicuspidata NRRL YB-4993]|uniref:Zn(2)-C6 fungal-type domain-containing protein n=1 Tax=Metschnikowia bicuspidata var. bicuspidata NRRL YB-4993 TaxID=869754 RepID=A0A1A0H7F7_9ASCO|nr:hypothetical protein METBIDRAFT_33018 [Metschnikowia bicuspidata var. bicuspidata NRRL YB-4993]OBA20029.1 hypothetical protein METBIDRAFT_33018 [Metschnikowia bicuspidata var. bicuspidata NRRL YB-4993]